MKNADTFALSFPDSCTSLLAGLVLGLVQYQFAKKQRQSFLVPWTMGNIIGLFLISKIGLFCYSMTVWINFKELSTPVEGIAQVAGSAALGGLFGGAILGAIQGRIGTWSNRLAWSWVNAVAWAGGWAMGHTATRLVIIWKYWVLEGLSDSLQLAVELGVMGTVAGLVSSSITGIFFFKLFPRSN
ncbi:MAG: hypothetical protein HC780_13460 [Leptolyngbyaceae cyanobacterium CSU_1_3]|nr:hypothetical protein [Leptolyngbyaceae cyanobacterium CSU_1_3]